MSAPKDTRPAFPYAFQHEEDSRFVTQGFSPGMSLRQYYVGQALVGAALRVSEYARKDIQTSMVALLAEHAVKLADAAIAAEAR